MLNLLLKGGLVVDGTGAPGRIADVGIRDGRIVSVGDSKEPAARVLDVTGLVVAPGFVDIHTHYDAQIFWDPMASPSALHGVTTVFGGNCGFTIAPMQPRDVDYVMRMLAAVEGMPVASLEAGLDWNWNSFGDWLARLDGRVGVNVAFLVGHSTLRRMVMGEDAVGKAAGPTEIAAMAQLLHESLDQGGMGFSSSWTSAHLDGDGRPVPSFCSERDELLELARVTGQHPGTVLQVAPGYTGVFADREVGLMIDMSRAANRSINWNTLRIQNNTVELVDKLMGYGTRAANEGACVVALTYPLASLRLVTLAMPQLWSSMPGWAEVMQLPITQRIERLSDPQVRQFLRSSVKNAEVPRNAVLGALFMWETLRFIHTELAANRALIGRTVGDVALERGQDPLDTLLDVAVSEKLATYFEISFEQEDTSELLRERARVWRDPRVIVGASDAGAHLDGSCGARYTTALLGQSVHQRKLLSLEAAVRLLTDVPARFYGLRDRGRIAAGWHADIVVFDASRIGPKPVHFRDDLPGGARRLFAEAAGITSVIVNGQEVVRDGLYTGKLPGTVLRSGRDLDTVTVRP